MHVHVCRKDDFFRQRRLNLNGVGGGIAFGKVYPARAYTTLVVLVYYFIRQPVIRLTTRRASQLVN